MHFLFGWQGITVMGIIGMVLWGLRLAFADFILDRLGDLRGDRLRRPDVRRTVGRLLTSAARRRRHRSSCG